MANDQQSNTGSFVATTSVWDIQQLQSIKLDSPEFRDLLVRLYQNINNIVLALNIKDAAYYSTTEFLNGQLFFPDPTLDPASDAQGTAYRQVYRTVIDFGALPNAGTKTVAHNLDITLGTTNYSFTRIYGAATVPNQSSFIPLPFSSPTLNQNIKLEVTDTNVSITTAINYTAYTKTYLILEYIKS